MTSRSVVHSSNGKRPKDSVECSGGHERCFLFGPECRVPSAMRRSTGMPLLSDEYHDPAQ